MKRVNAENKQCVIMGDMNLDLLQCNIHKKNTFIDSSISEGIIPKITKPTGITSTSATIIDHIYTDMLLNNYSTISSIIINDVADHLGTFLIR